MEQFNQQDLDSIISEIQHLSNKDEKNLSRQQLTEILQELNLPEDRIDFSKISSTMSLSFYYTVK